MSSSSTSDGPESSAPEDDGYELDHDDEDTGPLRVSASPPPPDDDWDSAPAQGTWAGRFDAPLTVSPRPVHTPRKTPNVPLVAIAAVIAVVVVAGVVFWLVRPSSDSPDSPNAEPTTSAAPASPSPREEDESRLLQLLPSGYSSESCDPVDPPKDALAQLNCERNSDPGGPLAATYTLARDKAALDAAFNEAVQAANRVNCPGNIQSPGPWRRNANPQQVSGMLFCGLREGQPAVIWTDDANLVISAVDAGPQGPTFPQLYAWWSSHS